MAHGTEGSFWIASTGATSFPALERDIEVDVCVIGAGIVGITAATLLQEAGLGVAVLEMGRVAQGATGYTTAKVTSGHNLIYSALEGAHGTKVARGYAQANEAGLAQIADRVHRDGIDCDFERRPNYVYCEERSGLQSIRQELEAAGRAGLDVSFADETSLPYPVAGAIRLENQAQFHPRKYLLHLTDRLARNGGLVFENTRAIGVHDDDPCVVETAAGRVRATDVVVATHYPFLNRALLFPRVHPKRSYAIAGPSDPNRLPDGMFISSDEPTRSIRTIRDGSPTLLMVGGEGHSVGQDYDTEARYRNLERWAGERFGLTVGYRWSTQDGASIDGLPYVGPVTRGSHNVYTATAFGKWGLSNGAVAAEIIAESILGRTHPWAALYDPHRITVKQSAERFVTENAKVGLHFVRDRLIHPQARGIEDLAPGEAGVIRGVSPIAAYRDRSGDIHAVSAVCTHLGCTVAWNEAEKSWDCPCHGSRFDVEGRVIEGPAVRDLGAREV